MKTFKLGLVSLLVAAMVAGFLAVLPAKAQTNTNLGSLIVLNGLFGGNSMQSLAGLIAVNNATGGGTTGVGTNLGDLIVLNGLFNGGGAGAGGVGGSSAVPGAGAGTSGYGASSYGGNNLMGLAGLIAVNNLYGGGQ